MCTLFLSVHTCSYFLVHTFLFIQWNHKPDCHCSRWKLFTWKQTFSSIIFPFCHKDTCFGVYYLHSCFIKTCSSLQDLWMGFQLLLFEILHSCSAILENVGSWVYWWPLSYNQGKHKNWTRFCILTCFLLVFFFMMPANLWKLHSKFSACPQAQMNPSGTKAKLVT